MKKLLPVALLGLAAACASAPKAPPPKAVETVKPAEAAPPPAPETPPAQLYAQAREKMAAKDWASAKANLDLFLEKQPDSAAGHFDSGWVSEQLKQPADAQKHYRSALKNEPAHVGAALNLARLLRRQDQLPDAESVLNAALEKRKGDPQVLNALAGVLRAQKRYDDAEASVRKVLVRHPRNAAAYKNLALVEADRGRVRLAELALQNARKLDPKDAGILNNLGLLAARRDDLSSARAKFLEAVELDQGYAPAWANLGALALRYRDYRNAAQAYQKATQLDQRWELSLAYAWALQGMKKHKDAREQYEKVLAVRPEQHDALFGRAFALKAEGNLPEAMKAFQAYVAVPDAPKAKDAQNQIAQIDFRLKNAAPVAKAEPQKKEVKGGGDLTSLPIGKDEETAAANAPPLPDLPPEEPEGVAATAVAPGGSGDGAAEKTETPKGDGADKKAEPAKEEKKKPAAQPGRESGRVQGEAQRASLAEGSAAPTNAHKGEAGGAATAQKPQANR